MLFFFFRMVLIFFFFFFFTLNENDKLQTTLWHFLFSSVVWSLSFSFNVYYFCLPPTYSNFFFFFFFFFVLEREALKASHLTKLKKKFHSVCLFSKEELPDWPSYWVILLLPGQKKNETTVRSAVQVHALSSMHVPGCSLACVAVSIFFGQGSKMQDYFDMDAVDLTFWLISQKKERERERDYVVSTSPYRIWLQVHR